MSEVIDLLITFDTTGSMYPCLTQVRRNIESMVTRLFKEIPGIRIGILPHGDYCDKNSSYVTKLLDLTDDQKSIIKFVREVGSTGGGDAPECYELVLHEARGASWKAGLKKVILMIGDDEPHGPDYRMNTRHLDWKNELKMLLEAGINVYGVHCMPECRRHSEYFYQEISKVTGGCYVPLDQFNIAEEMIMAVAYQQDSTESIAAFEAEIVNSGKMNRGMDRMFASITGRAPDPKYKASETFSRRSTRRSTRGIARGEFEFKGDAGELVPVEAGRFQVIPVDTSMDIQSFVKSQGLPFKTGRGFYEFSERARKLVKKNPKIQAYKEIILMDESGNFFTGNKAREMAGIPIGKTVTLRPEDLDGYTVFIQSTSNNRKILAGTDFLYEVAE